MGLAQQAQQNLHTKCSAAVLLLQASVREGKRESITTDLILKLLALDVCSETPIGNQMIRGVSGGQRKRVTTGEMMVGPKSVLLMDEVSDVAFSC